LDAKNPCLLNVCQNSTDNMACKDGISIYCLESKHVNNGVIEKGCVVILAKSATTTTTTRAPEPVTTTTTVSDHCPYKYFTLDATNPCHDVRCKAENMNNTECMKSVRDYCSASKMVHNDVEDACINVVKVPKAPTCPFKYFDLIDATNPCDITSCNINSAGEICKNAVVVYCTRSKEEKGDVEVGCLTVGKTPIMVTTTAAPITSTTPVPSYCPYKYTNLDAKSPCLVNACQNSTDNVECMDAIKIYCLESIT
jgi:hypothetical protein